MSEFIKYKRTEVSELRDVTEDDIKSFKECNGPCLRVYFDDGKWLNVSVSVEDFKAGSPKIGDKIARNPDNHIDQWLVPKEYFEKNFELLDEPKFDEKKSDASHKEEVAIDTFRLHHTKVMEYSLNNINDKREFGQNPMMGIYGIDTFRKSFDALNKAGYISDEDVHAYYLSDRYFMPKVLETPTNKKEPEDVIKAVENAPMQYAKGVSEQIKNEPLVCSDRITQDDLDYLEEFLSKARRLAAANFELNYKIEHASKNDAELRESHDYCNVEPDKRGIIMSRLRTLDINVIDELINKVHLDGKGNNCTAIRIDCVDNADYQEVCDIFNSITRNFPIAKKLEIDDLKRGKIVTYKGITIFTRKVEFGNVYLHGYVDDSYEFELGIGFGKNSPDKSLFGILNTFGDEKEDMEHYIRTRVNNHVYIAIKELLKSRESLIKERNKLLRENNILNRNR